MNRLYQRVYKKKNLYPDPGRWIEPQACRIKAYAKACVNQDKGPAYNERIEMRLSTWLWDQRLFDTVESVKQTMTDFAKYVQKYGIEIVYVYIPESMDIDYLEIPSDNIFYDYVRSGILQDNGIAQNLGHWMKEKKIPWIDLTEIFRKRKNKNCPQCRNYYYFAYNEHWNSNGHELAAEIIAEHLKAYPVVKQY